MADLLFDHLKRRQPISKMLEWADTLDSSPARRWHLFGVVFVS